MPRMPDELFAALTSFHREFVLPDMQRMEARIDARFDGFETRVAQRFADLETRVDDLGTRVALRFDALETRVDDFDARVRGRFDDVNGHIDSIYQRFERRSRRASTISSAG